MVSVGYEMVTPLGVIGCEFGVNWLKWLNERFQRYKTINFRIWNWLRELGTRSISIAQSGPESKRTNQNGPFPPIVAQKCNRSPATTRNVTDSNKFLEDFCAHMQNGWRGSILKDLRIASFKIKDIVVIFMSRFKSIISVNLTILEKLKIYMF